MTSHSDSDTDSVAPNVGWNAPPSPVALFAPPMPIALFAPPSAPASAPRIEHLSPATPTEVLDELTRVIVGARGALLASVDGFALARSDRMPNEASHAAMLAAAVGLAHQLVLMGGGEKLRQLVVDHDNGLLVLWPIGHARVLAMLTDADVDQGGLRRFVRSRSELLAGVS